MRESEREDDRGAAGWGEWTAFLRRVAVKRYGLAPDEAQDIAQDVICRTLPKLSGVRDLRAYLLQSLRNAVCELRERRREAPRSLEDARGPDHGTIAETCAARGPSAEEDLSHREALRSVLAEVQRIVRRHDDPKRDWLVFVEVVLKERRAVDVAAQVGVNPQVVYNVVFRILKGLERSFPLGSP